MVLNYIGQCFKKSFDGFFKRISTAYGLVTTWPITSFTGIMGRNIPIPDTVQNASLIKNMLYFILILFSVWLFRLTFLTPYFLWSNRRLDDPDIKHLLGGSFLGNTFIYNSRYDILAKDMSKDDMEKNKNKIFDIYVRAPQNSFAKIKFQFMNGRSNGSNVKCHFYIINKQGREKLIDNISEEQRVFVNEDFCFQFKISPDEGYKFLEDSSLRITIKGWTKV